MDIAVSHATLDAMRQNRIGPTFRLSVPGRVLAFGRSDRVRDGYRHAVRAADAHGFAPIERLAGGSAAVFHKSTISFSWGLPDDEPRAGIRDRFEIISSVIQEALINLGLDARVGEVPGEYCPGDWSINLGGRTKVAGVGQRLVRGAAHVGGVVVVDGSAPIRDVLIPVYRALKLDWDPRTSGALADNLADVDITDIAESIVTAFSNRFDTVTGELPVDVIRRAADLLPEHLPQVA
jgi:lipoate-protein ligase A